MNEKITTRPDAPDAPTAVVVKRFGDYDLALNDDGSVTWRDTGRVPVLHVAPAPAAEDRDPRAFEHTPEAAAFGAAIEQAAYDSGVGWDEVHPIELACRLMAAGYSLAARQPAPLSGVQEDAARRALADAGLDEADAAAAFDALTPWLTRQPAPVVSAEQVDDIVRRVQEQRFTDDDGHDVGTLRPIEARAAVVHTLASLGIEVQGRG